MNKFLYTLAALVFSAGIAHADPPNTVPASTNAMDFGIVAGAFAKKPLKVTAGLYTYYVIAPDMVEPACNSTQIVIWVDDPSIEGDAGGVAYNLGVNAGALISATADGDELKLVVSFNDVYDCSIPVQKEIRLKYKGGGEPLDLR